MKLHGASDALPRGYKKIQALEGWEIGEAEEKYLPWVDDCMV